MHSFSVGIVGINYKLADLKLRETLAKVCQKKFPQDFKHEDISFVLLNTCNRTEIYFSSPDLPLAHTFILNALKKEIEDDFDQKLYSYFGHECFSHLVKVTSGLDSACAFETEIQGQVKIAYEHALQARKLPFELHYLFQKSLSTSKHVRTQVDMPMSLPGLEEAIFNKGSAFFNDLLSTRILFIGASMINEKIFTYFKSKNLENITLASRHYERAKTWGIPLLSWDELSDWPSYDWIILGAKSQQYLIKNVPELITPKLAIDLSVPRNMDPNLAGSKNLSLFNIDQLGSLLTERKSRLEATLNYANFLIQDLSKRQMALFQQKRDCKLKIMALSA